MTIPKGIQRCFVCHQFTGRENIWTEMWSLHRSCLETRHISIVWHQKYEILWYNNRMQKCSFRIIRFAILFDGMSSLVWPLQMNILFLRFYVNSDIGKFETMQSPRYTVNQMHRIYHKYLEFRSAQHIVCHNILQGQRIWIFFFVSTSISFHFIFVQHLNVILKG